MFDDSIIYFFPFVFFSLICIYWLYSSYVKQKVLSAQYMTKAEFMNHYKALKLKDTSGCYVILIFNDPPVDFSEYDDVYIGQSIHIYQRLHQHFSGHGNHKVYQAQKQGRHIYVTFVTCIPRKMNVTERRLIRIFKATQSFNVQKGGAKRRM